MNNLYMNISAAVIILITIFIRKITINKIPHFTFNLLWGLAAIRMLIPFRITSDWCAFNFLFKLRDCLFANEVIYLKLKARQIQQGVGNYIDINLATSIFNFVWMIGIIVFSGYFVMSYTSGKRLIMRSVKCNSIDEDKIKQWLKKYNLNTDIEIKISNEIDVPLAYGCFKSGILLPNNFKINNEINAIQILLHECMHIKNYHALIKLLLAILVCMCWFNPCAWALFKYINRDMEISCDRHVLEILGREQRESYALNLLKSSQMQYKDSIVYSGFAKNSIKERIVAIMSFKKMSVYALVLSLSIPTCVATVFATTDNRVDGNNTNDIEIVASENNLQVSEEVFLTINESKLTMYVDENEIARAAHNLYIDDYEYISTSMPPEKITVKFTDSGYTYKGTLSLYELQIKNGKYYGYYEGWTSRV